MSKKPSKLLKETERKKFSLFVHMVGRIFDKQQAEIDELRAWKERVKDQMI